MNEHFGCLNPVIGRLRVFGLSQEVRDCPVNIRAEQRREVNDVIFIYLLERWIVDVLEHRPQMPAVVGNLDRKPERVGVAQIAAEPQCGYEVRAVGVLRVVLEQPFAA